MVGAVEAMGCSEDRGAAAAYTSRRASPRTGDRKMTETIARLDARQKDVAELRERNGWLESQLMQWDPNYLLKRDLPNAEQGLALFKKIVAKYPRMRSPSDSETDQAMGLVAAMAFAFTCTKTDKAVSKYDGSWWLGRVEAFSRDARLGAPRIRSLLIGIIATNDVPYVLSNKDVYLDPYGRGAPISRDSWRRLLDGAPVREPMVVRQQQVDRTIGHVNQIPSW
jgi:hypothetical protein